MKTKKGFKNKDNFEIKRKVTVKKKVSKKFPVNEYDYSLNKAGTHLVKNKRIAQKTCCKLSKRIIWVMLYILAVIFLYRFVSYQVFGFLGKNTIPENPKTHFENMDRALNNN